MQGNTCTKNAIEMKHIFAVASNISEADVVTNIGLVDQMKYFTDNQLKLIEADLTKHHASDVVERSMKLLSIIQRSGSSRKKSKSNSVNCKIHKMAF